MRALTDAGGRLSRGDAFVLAQGLAVASLLGGCVATAWPGSSPLAPGRGGRLLGDHGWAWAYLGLEIAAFAAYVTALPRLRRRAIRPLAVAAVAVAVQLVPLGAPLLLSSDAWTYWDYGRIAAVHSANPYTSPPAAFPDDAAYPWVGSGWRHTTSVYGPAFTLASEPAALAAGSSHTAAAWLYKALAALGMVAATLLALRLSPRPGFAAALVGWNPLLALQFAGGGHNDAWMAALVLAALALAASGRRQLAGVAWALAALVKWVPLLLLPLRALEARRTGREVRHLAFGLTAAAVCGVASWRYGWHWLSGFGPLARNANHESSFALPRRLEDLGLPHPGGIVLLAVLFAVCYAGLLRAAAGGRARLGLALGLLLLATPWLVPWYAVWAVPLAAAEDDAPAQWLAVGISAYLLRQAVPL